MMFFLRLYCRFDSWYVLLNSRCIFVGWIVYPGVLYPAMKLDGGWRRKKVEDRVWGQGCINRVVFGPGQRRDIVGCKLANGQLYFFWIVAFCPGPPVQIGKADGDHGRDQFLFWERNRFGQGGTV
jgi:hypothetical protein